MNEALRLGFFLLAGATPALAAADAAALARNCAHCHGLAGRSNAELIPHIGGQYEGYLKTVLSEYKLGKRPSLFMGRLAKAYTDQELEAVAVYFSRLAWSPTPQNTDPGSQERGRQLAQERCAACHGGGDLPGSGTAPRLAGQWAAYLKTELARFMDPQARITDPGMRAALTGLGAVDLDALADFYAVQR